MEEGFKLLHECFQLCTGRMNKNIFFAYRVCFLEHALHSNSFKIYMMSTATVICVFNMSTKFKENFKNRDISMKGLCKYVSFQCSFADVLSSAN